MPIPQQIYGWVKDDADPRDFLYAQQGEKVFLLPRIVYAHTAPVMDQGDEGSCVFHGTVAAMEAVLVAMGKKFSNWSDQTQRYLSSQFGYYQYREIYDDVNQDNGASIRAACKMLANKGICLENLWPYDTSKLTVKPSADCYTDALKHRIEKYLAIKTVDDMMHCIASGWGFVGGITCFESLTSKAVANTGVIPLPRPGEKETGGHCVYFWGYDQTKKVFYGQNSWGTDWGMKAPTCSTRGFFSIPFDYLVSYADDFWTIRLTSDAANFPSVEFEPFEPNDQNSK